MTSNQINLLNVKELKRSNLAREKETKRANLVNEALSRERNELQHSYNTNILSHYDRQLSETVRHNKATEQKDLVYMNSVLAETNRANLANEAIKRESNAIQAQSIQNQYTLGTIQASELNRHNLATEKANLQSIANSYEISLINAAETQRSNVQQQILNYNRYVEDKRHNIAVEEETHRANTAKEIQETRKTDIQGTKVAVDVINTSIRSLPLFMGR